MQIIPLTVSATEYDLWVILEADNIERMRAYDPGEIITNKLPEPWKSMRPKNIMLCYATPLDMAEVTKRIQAGEIRQALKFLSRGFRFRPDAGDHDEFVQAPRNRVRTMQSESIFTATSGARCQYEVSIVDGRASASVVWLGQPPTERDMEEIARFLEAQADQANFPHTGHEHVILGEIRKEDLPRVSEIIRERLAESSEA